MKVRACLSVCVCVPEQQTCQTVPFRLCARAARLACQETEGDDRQQVSGRVQEKEERRQGCSGGGCGGGGGDDGDATLT